MELQMQYTMAILLSLAGAILGAVYDIYRTSLKEWRFLRRFSALFDISFWIFATVFVFTMLLGTSDGDVRIVVFVLLAVGLFIYRKTLHPLIVASTRILIRFVYQVFCFFWKMAMLCFVTPVRYLWFVFWVLLRRTDRTLQFLEPYLVWPVILLGRSAFFLEKKYLRKMLLVWKELYERLSNKYGAILTKWIRIHSKSAEDDAKDDET